MLDIFQQVGQWYPNATNKDLNAGKRLRKEKGEAYKNYFQAYDVDKNMNLIYSTNMHENISSLIWDYFTNFKK